MQRKERFDLIANRKMWFLISAVVIMAGIVSMVIRGMNYGVDFTGGRIVQFRAEKKVSTEEVEKILADLNVKHNPVQLIGNTGKEFVVRMTDYTETKQREDLEKKIDEFLIRVNVEFNSINKDGMVLRGLSEKVSRDKLNETLKKAGYPEDAVLLAGTKEVEPSGAEKETTYDVRLKLSGATSDADVKKLATAIYADFGGYTPFISQDKVDPAFGSELKKRALYALVIATIGILLYVTIRFEFWYAVAAIIALIHDCLITLGATSILQIEVNSAFVAVILTVFGYSINDTIVIFDRIRENLRKDKKTPLGKLINMSLWETMTRSINTVLTVVLTIVAILLLGGHSLYDFMRAMLIGVVCGCYSSIFVAAPLAFVFKSAQGDKRAEEAPGRRPAPKPAAKAAGPAKEKKAVDSDKAAKRKYGGAEDASGESTAAAAKPASSGGASTGGGKKKPGKQRRR